jgi:Ribosomal protein L7/L12 dimerisation domain
MADLSKLADVLSSLTVLEAAELAKRLEEKWQPLKVRLADIKNDLPTWPDEVIKEWLLYLANREDTGWPPPSPLGFHPWAFILGHRPIQWWGDVTWKLEKTDCSFENLSQSTRHIVRQTRAEIASKTADPSTTRRFHRAFQYILHHDTFEKPLVAIQIASGLSILDGNHRIAAFCFLQDASAEWIKRLGGQKPAQEQEVWVGTHSRGETPFD